MSNLTNTTNDLGSCALEVWGTLDATLHNDAGAEDTFAAGTLLARHATDGKLRPYDPADTTQDLDQPKYVLTYDVTIAATSDAAVTVMSAGKVNQNRLIIHDGTTVAAVHLDALLNRPIIPVDVEQLALKDNPQS